MKKTLILGVHWSSAFNFTKQTCYFDTSIKSLILEKDGEVIEILKVPHEGGFIRKLFENNIEITISRFSNILEIEMVDHTFQGYFAIYQQPRYIETPLWRTLQGEE